MKLFHLSENISESIPECMCDTPTNNIAELWAMIRALEIAGNNSKPNSYFICYKFFNI